MSTAQLTRKEILKKGFVLNAVKFLKEIHYICKDGYNDINVAMFSKKHNVSPETIPTMVKLGILTRNNNLKSAKFYWNKEFNVSEVLAESIYERITSDKRIYYANKKLEDQSKRGKKLIPIIGSKRIFKDQVIDLLKTDQLLDIMRSIHEQTKDGALQSRESILNIIKESYFKNSEALLKALIDGKYLVPKHFSQVELYTWKEQEPNHDHAVFIKDLMREQNSELFHTVQQPDHKKVERVFNLLNDLHKIKEFTKFTMRDKITSFGLNKNDQVVICGQVLEQEGPKMDRSYRWKPGVVPSRELATELLLKSRSYAKSVNNGGLNPDNNTKVGQKMDWTDVVRRKNNNDSQGNTVQSNTSIESTHDDASRSIQDLVRSMQAEKLKLLERLEYLNARIDEGQGILDLKEKEKKFISSFSNLLQPRNENFSQMDKITKNHKRHKHTKEEILNLLAIRKTITTTELIEHFYPGQNHKNDAVRALTAMMYALKNKKLIDNSTSGVYKSIN